MLKLIPLFCGLIGLLVAYIYFAWIGRVNKRKASTKTIEDNLGLFHRNEWISIITAIVVLCVAVGVFVSWFAGAVFIYGAAVAILAEFVGSRAIAKGRTQLTVSADDTDAFRITYRAGVVAGVFMTSFGLLTIGAIFIPFKLKNVITAIACYAFGTSTVVLFNKNRFKPVADMYDSYIATIVSCILLSTYAVNSSGLASTFNNRTAALYSLVIAGLGLIASVIGSFFVRGRAKSWTGIHVNICVIVAAILFAGGAAYVSLRLLQHWVYAVALIIGLVMGIASGICSTKKMIVVPILLFIVAIMIPYNFVGLYGIPLAAIGFVSVTAVLASINSFGVVSDVESKIVNLGNGYSTCASSLAVLALFVAYVDLSKLEQISIINPTVLSGLMVGVTMPLVYASMYSQNTEERDYSMLMDIVAILIPLVVGLLFGIQTLGGLLGGLVTSGMITSFIVNNSSNGKENITTAHVVVSSINVLIKFTTLTAVVLAPVFTQFGSIISG